MERKIMRMRPLILWLLVVIVIFILFLVGRVLLRTTPTEGDLATVPVDMLEPTWFDIRDDPYHLFVYGSAEKETQIEAETAAEEIVISNTVDEIQTYVIEILNNIIDEADETAHIETEVIDRIVHITSTQTYIGAYISEHETLMTEAGGYKSYIRYKIPKEEIIESVVSLIKDSDDLYDAVKDIEIFQELKTSSAT